MRDGGKGGESGREADVVQTVVAGRRIVHHDARCPRTAGGGVPDETGEGDELVEGAHGAVVVAGEVESPQGVAEELDEGKVGGNMATGLGGGDEVELVQGPVREVRSSVLSKGGCGPRGDGGDRCRIVPAFEGPWGIFVSTAHRMVKSRCLEAGGGRRMAGSKGFESLAPERITLTGGPLLAQLGGVVGTIWH